MPACSAFDEIKVFFIIWTGLCIFLFVIRISVFHLVWCINWNTSVRPWKVKPADDVTLFVCPSPRQPQLLWEGYSLAYFRRSLSIARNLFMQLSELGHHGENDIAQNPKQQQRGFDPGLLRLRVHMSTQFLQDG